jgi:hypothetical protein
MAQEDQAIHDASNVLVRLGPRKTNRSHWRSPTQGACGSDLSGDRLAWSLVGLTSEPLFAGSAPMISRIDRPPRDVRCREAASKRPAGREEGSQPTATR